MQPWWFFPDTNGKKCGYNRKKQVKYAIITAKYLFTVVES